MVTGTIPRMSRYLRVVIVPILLMSVLALASCTMWGEKKHPGWKGATSGEQLTRLFWQAVKEKNWKEVQSHIGATAIGMSARGDSTREQMMEHLKSMEISDFQIGEVRSEPAGADLIVSYTLTVKGTVGGQPLPSSVRMMSVWQEVKNGWIIVAHSSVPAA